MNTEQAEAQTMEKTVADWCTHWKVDVSRLKKNYVVEADGRLVLELEAPLTVPITSLKTRLVLANAEPLTGTGSEVP